MKKKLLITLGCSHTQGIGTWDMSLNYPTNMKPGHPSFGEWLFVNRERFHKLGWPNRLGKKLGYDKVINLAKAGSSTSSQMKTFILKSTNKTFSDDRNKLAEYDVSVIWLLTSAFRTSHFREGVDVSLLPDNIGFGDRDDLFKSIYEFVSKNGKRNSNEVFMDYLREEYVNRKIVATLCELKNWNFVSFHTQTHFYEEEINKIYQGDSTHFSGDVGFSQENNEELISNLCGHFNEKGYEMIATNMYHYIKNNHPNLLGDISKKTIEWSWQGDISFDSMVNR